MAGNTDIEFANKLRDIITFLFEKIEDPHREEAYNIALKLLNARFGACPRCGHINSGGKFCAECGQQLAGEILDKQNDNIESIDYLVCKKTGNNLHILSIADTEQQAITNLRKHLNSGISAELYKRILEKVNL